MQYNEVFFQAEYLSIFLNLANINELFYLREKKKQP